MPSTTVSNVNTLLADLSPPPLPVVAQTLRTHLEGVPIISSYQQNSVFTDSEGISTETSCVVLTPTNLFVFNWREMPLNAPDPTTGQTGPLVTEVSTRKSALSSIADLRHDAAYGADGELVRSTLLLQFSTLDHIQFLPNDRPEAEGMPFGDIYPAMLGYTAERPASSAAQLNQLETFARAVLKVLPL